MITTKGYKIVDEDLGIGICRIVVPSTRIESHDGASAASIDRLYMPDLLGDAHVERRSDTVVI